MANFAYESASAGEYQMPASPHSSGEVYVNTGRAAIDASYAASDMIGLCVLPKGCIPVDFVMKSEALDGGASVAAACTVSIGISKVAKSDLVASTTIIANSTVPRAGGIDNVDVTDLVLQGLRAKNKDRLIAAKVTAGPGSSASTSGAVAGELMGELYYRAVEADEWDSSPSSIA